MKIRGIDHVALYTDRFEETILFFRDVFDAEDLGTFQAKEKGCWLAVGDSVLEIFDSVPSEDGWFQHIAVGTDDVDALFARALDHGAAPLEEPKDIRMELKKPMDARIAFVRGINGEQIELFCRR